MTARVSPRSAPGVPTRRGLAKTLVSWLGSRYLRGVLLLIAAFWMMPVAGLFVVSLRDETDNGVRGWWTAFAEPAQLTLDNYRAVVEDTPIGRSVWNTVVITVPATILVVVISVLAAYALAWIDFRGRDGIMVAIVGMLVMPIQVALIPIAKLYGLLGVFGSVPSVVAFHVAMGLPFGVFLLRNFFVGIPRDMLEAARIDGAREWAVLRRVVVPVARPAIASLAIFQFLWVWNDLLVALVFAGTDAAPVTVALQSELRQFGANLDVLATGSVLSMLVPLVVFFSLQRYFVQGVLAGSTK